MSESATFVLNDPVQGHAEMQRAWHHAKPHLVAGRRLVLRLEDYEDAKTEEQRGYYHVILEFIAEHARSEGQKFPMQVWKEWFREQYLGYKVKTFTNPITGRKSRRRIRVSTEDLGIKGYARLIDKVTAFASTDLGLTVPPPRKRLPDGMRVDAETGEVMETA
jgi:hypothetical protein